MKANTENAIILKNKSVFAIFWALVIVGFMSFAAGLFGEYPERAWQAYLINFLLWSAIAQGGLLFSALMHLTRAKWSGPLSGLSEAFAAFFPVSFGLFIFLFAGKSYVFPWLHHDLHGKEIWLNLPFLFSRDCIALLILYGIGFGYLYQSLCLKVNTEGLSSKVRSLLCKNKNNPENIKAKKTIFSVLYCIAFAFVLSLIGYDLVMATDPHWVSTLFGAYSFVKAIYVGFGALIILAAIIYIREKDNTSLTESHFHDIGKLFFAFCLVWGDFFYCQLVVIWYGNISEETHYVIQRTMTAPWNGLAWFIFSICFIIPFIILINKKVKTMPKFMIFLCSVIILGIWLEHLLLLGPAITHAKTSLPLGFSDILISLGFFGLMALSISFFLKIFPELIPLKAKDVN